MKTILTLVKRIKMALAGVEREGVRGASKPEKKGIALTDQMKLNLTYILLFKT